jgi:hypothetical protein
MNRVVGAAIQSRCRRTESDGSAPGHAALHVFERAASATSRFRTASYLITEQIDPAIGAFALTVW